MRIVLHIFLFAMVLLATDANAVQLTLAGPAASNTVGAQVAVSVELSGLTAAEPPGLGSFDIDIGFDPGILSFQSAGFSTGLDAFGLGDVQSVTPGPGVVNLFELSLDSPSDLIAHQTNAFRLATLMFVALAPGSSPLTITINALADAAGLDLPATALGTNVSISAVPEPASGLLLLMGLGLLFMMCEPRKR
ncbi:MAG: PEP-CTERM sorting domain-containing protein [Betaproteobacteria bacterium]|nr:PEP-CTERM sorting domain-containing protein [Betaproteobacteria bacterium]